MDSIGFTVFDTPIGALGIAWSAAGITRVQLPERDRAATESRLRKRSGAEAAEPPPAVARLVDLLKRYAAGERVEFDAAAIDLDGVGDFERGVYAVARKVPYGETLTYGAVATAVGARGAAQAVGKAMGANPLPIVVPCHRIVAAGNRFGGFSAHGGVFAKERLLALEGAGAAGPLIPGLLV